MAPTTARANANGARKSYLTGFALAIVLTAIPFALVTSGGIPHPLLIGVIFAAAAVQFLVHLHYFLHLDGSPEQRWNRYALLFTAAIIAIIIGGTIWIMSQLDYSMMAHTGSISMK